MSQRSWPSARSGAVAPVSDSLLEICEHVKSPVWSHIVGAATFEAVGKLKMTDDCMRVFYMADIAKCVTALGKIAD